MDQSQSKNTTQHLREIAEILLLNGTLEDCPGLIHGKMGIAVFFFHYAKYLNNKIFENYAFDLIGEIQEQIHSNSPADYERGIAGIGVGINYIIQNGFLDADNDLFDDFDQRMVRAVMYNPWQDFSLYDGLTGYGRYWIMRIQYHTSTLLAHECLSRIVRLIEENFSIISENEQTDVYSLLHDLHQMPYFEEDVIFFESVLEQCQNWSLHSLDISRSFPRLGSSITNNIARMYQYNRYFNIDLHGKIELSLKKILNTKNMEKQQFAEIGLLTGYAGDGMMLLTALNQTDMSWMLLL